MENASPYDKDKLKCAGVNAFGRTNA